LSLLPALSSWRTRSLQRARSSTWRHQIGWSRLDPETTGSSGCASVLVVSEASAEEPLVAAIVATKQFELVTCGLDEARESLAERLRDALPDGGLVVSLLALDITPHPVHPPLATGLVLNLLLAQTL